MKHDSPFQKKDTSFKRELSTYESFREYAVTRLDKMFMDYLPSDDIKAMSPEYLYPIGVLAFLGLLGIFLAVFLNGYYSAVNKEFLSPFSGTTASKNCILIPTINTGTYLATETGYWQGQDGFQFGDATLQLTTVSTAFSTEEYTYLMNKAYFSMDLIKNNSQKQDLAANLVYWMSAQFVPYTGNTAQRLAFMGTPLVVFDRQKVIGTVSNVQGSCNASSSASFNSESGLLTLVYNYDEYVNNPICNDTISPAHLSYDPVTDGGKFTMQIDTRSIITAVAVNMGTLDVEDLVVIDDLQSIYYFDGVNYTVNVMYDPKYNGMEPISCINVNSTLIQDYTFCVLKVENEVYAIPLFNHHGVSENMPEPCNCSTIDAADLASSYFSCNLFSFMTGVLFFPSNSPDEIMRMWIDIGLVDVNDVILSPVNSYAFDAQYIDSYWGLTSVNRTLFEQQSYREKAYSFCNVTGNSGPCALMTFSVFDKIPQNWAVTTYYHQLLNGACQNSFVPDYKYWEMLIAQPFAPLNQDYQKCSYEQSTVIINQAGSSVGTVSILTPLCIAFILVLVYFAQSCGMANIKKTYTNTEKDSALDDLALKLLLVRDSDQAAIELRDSVLARLVNELSEDTLINRDLIYRDSGKSKEQKETPKINWTALQASLGIRREALPVSALPRQGHLNSISSVSDGVVFARESGDELHSVSSPIHFLDISTAALVMKAEKEKYSIMNDYRVTPELLQMCSKKKLSKSSPKSPQSRKSSQKALAASRTESTTSADNNSSKMENGGRNLSEVGEASECDSNSSSSDSCDKPTLDLDSLFGVLNHLLPIFQAGERDRKKTIWTAVNQTAILRTIQLSTLPPDCLSHLYYLLYTLLSLHGAIMLNIPLAEVKDDRASSVAYIVGEEVLTLAELKKRL